jgi:hypothetical protein
MKDLRTLRNTALLAGISSFLGFGVALTGFALYIAESRGLDTEIY